jgi:hypothetical protein
MTLTAQFDELFNVESPLLTGQRVVYFFRIFANVLYTLEEAKRPTRSVMETWGILPTDKNPWEEPYPLFEEFFLDLLIDPTAAILIFKFLTKCNKKCVSLLLPTFRHLENCLLYLSIDQVRSPTEQQRCEYARRVQEYQDSYRTAMSQQELFSSVVPT